MLESREGLITLISPDEHCSFLQEVSQRAANDSEMAHKLSIVASKAEETPEFLDIGWLLPVVNGLNLVIFSGHSMLADDMPKIG
jgi:hypothetical protein